MLLICISVASIMHILFHCFARQGDTPLIMATKKGMTDAVKLLLDRGADISSKNQVNILIQMYIAWCKIQNILTRLLCIMQLKYRNGFISAN